MLTPVQKKLVFEEVADQIRLQIENGALKGGERLPSELQLCEIFQVSRGSVRVLKFCSSMDSVPAPTLAPHPAQDASLVSLASDSMSFLPLSPPDRMYGNTSSSVPRHKHSVPFPSPGNGVQYLRRLRSVLNCPRFCPRLPG